MNRILSKTSTLKNKKKKTFELIFHLILSTSFKLMQDRVTWILLYCGGDSINEYTGKINEYVCSRYFILLFLFWIIFIEERLETIVKKCYHMHSFEISLSVLLFYYKIILQWRNSVSTNSIMQHLGMKNSKYETTLANIGLW